MLETEATGHLTAWPHCMPRYDRIPAKRCVSGERVAAFSGPLLRQSAPCLESSILLRTGMLLAQGTARPSRHPVR
jgi:hypothetical protein